MRVKRARRLLLGRAVPLQVTGVEAVSKIRDEAGGTSPFFYTL